MGPAQEKGRGRSFEYVCEEEVPRTALLPVLEHNPGPRGCVHDDEKGLPVEERAPVGAEPLQQAPLTPLSAYSTKINTKNVRKRRIDC